MTCMLLAGFMALALACALTDIWVMRIPNVLVGLIVILFAGYALSLGKQDVLMANIVPAIAAFLLAFPLFVLGKFGGGDVKLLAATVLWVGSPNLGPFLLFLGLFGFLSIILFVVLRSGLMLSLEWTAHKAGVALAMPKSLRQSSMLPYGTVIAAAGITTLWSQLSRCFILL